LSSESEPDLFAVDPIRTTPRFSSVPVSLPNRMVSIRLILFSHLAEIKMDSPILPPQVPTGRSTRTQCFASLPHNYDVDAVEKT
jgi:hypothetical protein